MVEKILKARQMDVYEVGCYISLYELLAASPLAGKVNVFKNKLQQLVNASIERNPGEWGKYVMRPSMYLETVDSDFCPGNEETVEKEVEYIRRAQNADGTWDITWQWGGYEREFAVATVWWKGYWIVRNMRDLKSFGG